MYKVLNIHHRILDQPASEIGILLNTLASDNDRMLATDKWPRMNLDKGLQIGSKGGHGPIKYHIIDYQPTRTITFQFDLKGFHGFHRFDIVSLDIKRTNLLHTIDMNTSGWATFQWIFAIRWLHDAYIEDAFDKIENQFTNNKKSSKWNIWVQFLRAILKPGRRKTKPVSA